MKLGISQKADLYKFTTMDFFMVGFVKKVNFCVDEKVFYQIEHTLILFFYDRNVTLMLKILHTNKSLS